MTAPTDLSTVIQDAGVDLLDEHPTLTSEAERLIAAEALLAEHLPTMRRSLRLSLLQKRLEGIQESIKVIGVSHGADAKPAASSPSVDPADPSRTLTDHLEDLLRVDEVLDERFPQTPSAERIAAAVEIVSKLKWGAL